MDLPPACLDSFCYDLKYLGEDVLRVFESYKRWIFDSIRTKSKRMVFISIFLTAWMYLLTGEMQEFVGCDEALIPPME